MCLKYNEGLLKTQSNEANYHMLAKILKFSITKIQCAHIQSRGLFLGCNVGSQEGEKEVDKCFGNVELIAKNYGAPNNEPNKVEEH